jgi:hypothetical protein
LLEPPVILAHHFNLQVLARTEMREDTALAHLHTFREQADGQPFEPVADDSSSAASRIATRVISPLRKARARRRIQGELTGGACFSPFFAVLSGALFLT